MKSRAILVVSGIWPPEVGGPASHAPSIARHLISRGHRVAALVSGGPTTQRFEYPLRVLSADRPLPVRMIEALVALRKASASVDVVYATGFYHRVALATHRRTPVVMKLSQDPAWERAHRLGLAGGDPERFTTSRGATPVAALKLARDLAIATAAAVIVPSAYLARTVERWRGSSRTVVIPNAAPARVPSESRAELRRRLGIDGPSAVFAGRLVPAKRLDLVVEALRRVPRLELVVLGDGSERGAIEAAIARAGVGDRLRMRGGVPRAEVLEWLKACDFAVLPSDWENHPHLAVEATSLGTPVIGTDVGGIPEIVVPGVSGVLIPPGDAEALASAMQELVGSPEALASLRDSCAAAARHLDEQEVNVRTEQILLEVASRA